MDAVRLNIGWLMHATIGREDTLDCTAAFYALTNVD